MESYVIVSVTTIAGGVALLVVLIWQRARARELTTKERIALIERGLVPSPETDPARFEALLGRPVGPRPVGEKAARYRTLGIMVTGLGAGLLLLIGVAAGELETAIGVGGAIIAIGAALLVNSRYCGPDRVEGDRYSGPPLATTARGAGAPAAGSEPPLPPAGV